jgi:hypothetical protein
MRKDIVRQVSTVVTLLSLQEGRFYIVHLLLLSVSSTAQSLIFDLIENTGFFVVEISLSILAFGYKYFFDVIRVIDMIVIFGTFVMEIYFKVRHFGEDTIKLIIM